MIGKINLNQKQIKSYLESYYKKIYKDAYIKFYDVDYCPNDTGIALVRNINIDNNKEDLVIEEYLDNLTLVEVFNSIFDSVGYSIKEIYPDIHRSGSGYSECISLNSLNLTLEKENIKKKVK